MTDHTDALERALAAVHERLDRLEHENAALRSLVQSQRGGAPQLDPPSIGAGEPEVLDRERAVSRRGLLLGSAGALAAGAAGAVAMASPAAADGQNMIVGSTNTATTNTTTVTAPFSDRAVLAALNTSTATALYGRIQDPTGQGLTAAVLGDSKDSTAVAGMSTTNTGVYGRRGAPSSKAAPAAVVGDSAAGDAVGGYSLSGTAVRGLRGNSTNEGAPAGAVVGEAQVGPAVVAVAHDVALLARATGVGVTTGLLAESYGGRAIQAVMYGTGSGVHGISEYEFGATGLPTDAGVRGTSGANPGVAGSSGTANGVVGNTGSLSSFNLGPGTTFAAAGVRGDAQTSPGVVGTSGSQAGVVGASASAIGVEARSNRAQLHLALTGSRPSPVAESGHAVGELVRDSNGDLWACVADGTWRKLAGPGSAGSFHVLPAPVHVYDSRPFTNPNVGSKTPLTANTPRTIDLTAASSGVPAGATAAMVNVLLLNTTAGNGNFTIWANGVPKPVATTMVWGGAAGGRYCSLAVTALDSSGKCQVQASIKLDIAIDVVGYYR